MLGQQVEFRLTDILHRQHDSTTRDQFQRIVTRTGWRSSRWPSPDPVRGVVVGVRTLSDGRNEYHGYDEPILYCPEEHFEAYLVAYDMRRKPVYVLRDNLKEV
jgi:hypothetical protein